MNRIWLYMTVGKAFGRMDRGCSRFFGSPKMSERHSKPEPNGSEAFVSGVVNLTIYVQRNPTAAAWR